MAANDWALVVGISAYPELGNLDGPENDATAFHRWLVGAGGVPAANATRILSSELLPQPALRATDAKPTMDAIYHEFDVLDDRAEENRKNGLGRQVGRRLYLFLAGHGFGPDLDDAALLMANATRWRRGYHVPGKLNANRFFLEALFEEVVLLMDCCRESYQSSPLVLPYGNRIAADVDNARRFYGFSSKWGRLSRERMIGGEVHGVFTATLMNGLAGAAAEPNGDVTAASLGSYLRENMKKLLDPADLTNPDIAKEPDLSYDPIAGSAFVIATVPPKRFPVTVTLSPAARGRGIKLFDGKLALVDQTAGNGATWELQLYRGAYLAIADGGAQTRIDVDGTGVVHADL